MPGIDTSFVTARAAQEVQKAVVAKLLGSIEQAGQVQAPVARVDTVQISAQARELAALDR